MRNPLRLAVGIPTALQWRVPDFSRPQKITLGECAGVRGILI